MYLILHCGPLKSVFTFCASSISSHFLYPHAPQLSPTTPAYAQTYEHHSVSISYISCISFKECKKFPLSSAIPSMNSGKGFLLITFKDTGYKVILTFAFWCCACLPHINSLASALMHSSSGFSFIASSMQESILSIANLKFKSNILYHSP
jgi:hypothetical protein